MASDKLKRVVEVGLDQYTMEFAAAIVEADRNGDHMHFGDKDKTLAAFAQLWLLAHATIEKQALVVEAARLLSDAMYVGVGEREGMRGLWCSTRNGPADHAALMIALRSAIDAMADAEGGE